MKTVELGHPVLSVVSSKKTINPLLSEMAKCMRSEKESESIGDDWHGMKGISQHLASNAHGK